MCEDINHLTLAAPTKVHEPYRRELILFPAHTHCAEDGCSCSAEHGNDADYKGGDR